MPIVSITDKIRTLDHVMTVTRRQSLFITGIIFAALLFAGFFVENLLEERWAENQRKTAINIAYREHIILEQHLNHALSATYGLAAILRQSGGNIQNFDTLAKDMVETYGGISSLQLAPNAVVTKVYPLKGNEKAIGHDLIKDPRRRSDVLKAIKTRKLTLAGPFELIQGGTAVIGRLPVFMPGQTGKERFWGLTIVLIRMPDLLKEAGLERLNDKGYDYELSSVSPDSGRREYIFGSRPINKEKPVALTMRVPNAKWLLEVYSRKGWSQSFPRYFALGGFTLFSMLICYIIFGFLRKSEILKHEVSVRTKELSENNIELQTEIAGRKVAEEGLSRNLALMNATLESTADGILVIDAEDKIASYNRKFVELWKLSPEIIARQNDEEITNYLKGQLKTPGQFWARNKDMILKIMDAVSADYDPDILKCKDGRIIERFMKPQKIGEQIVGRVLSFRDITALRKKEEWMSKMNGCFLEMGIDADENINKLVKLCGEMLGGTCALYNHLDKGLLCSEGQWNTPPDYEPVDKPGGHICYDVIQQGREEVFLVRDLPGTIYAESDPNVKKYGLETYIGYPVKCGDNCVGSLCVVFQTDFIPDRDDERLIAILASAIGTQEQRKEIKEELATEKERLNITLRSIGDGVIATDNDGRITSMSKIAEKLTGWSQNEALGKSCGEVFRIFDDQGGVLRENPFPLPLENGKPSDYLCQDRTALLMSKDGTDRWLAFVCNSICDKDSEPLGAVIVFRDITDARKLEEERIRADKMETIEMLAGGIAHDFNNILMGIVGNISLIKEGVASDLRLFTMMSEVEKAAFRASELTQRLLTFTKRANAIKKTVNTRALLEEFACFALRGTNVKCACDYAEDLWSIEADEGQIGQVINNLLINAQHAMPDGGEIVFKAENIIIDHESTTLPPGMLSNGRYVRISIKDAGTGISEEHMERIFDPYFTTKTSGSGLGLATVYIIIKNHGGYIAVESKPGRGTEFVFYLPASASPSHEETAADEIVLGTGRILLMDDEEIVRETACNMLTYLGYRVEAAGDGNQAIERYQEAKKSGKPFAAAIMDLTIPGGMGGMEAIKRLREIDPDIKAVVSSGYSSDLGSDDFQGCGFDAAIKKPYGIVTLSKVLSNLIGNGKNGC